MRKFLCLILSMLLLTGCASAPAGDLKTNSLGYIGDVDTGKKPVLMNPDLPVKKLVIVSEKGSSEFQVEIAATDAQRKSGLMNRKSLDDDKGMLFVFQRSGFVNFWMKNTLIPLDLLFIDSNGYIKHIARSAQPCTSTNDRDCVLYNSHFSVQYVLELKGGISDRLGLKEGDKAKWL